MSAIAIRRLLHVELHYDVLAHVDLGRDAASLFDRRRDPPAWARELRELLALAPDRLRTQVLPLASADLDEHLARLEATPCGARLAAAMRARRPAVEDVFCRGAAAADARAAELLARFGQTLAHARAALWGERPAPPLEIRDAGALAWPGGTHGRATTVAGRRVVAVALVGAPLEQVVCQILHEETHAVTDAAVRAAFAGAPRDTRAKGPGYALHRALEREAIAAGGRIVDRLLPELRPAYGEWRHRWE